MSASLTLAEVYLCICILQAAPFPHALHLPTEQEAQALVKAGPNWGPANQPKTGPSQGQQDWPLHELFQFIE